MTQYEKCPWCGGWVNMLVTPHHVVVTHDGTEHVLHSAHCVRWFLEEENGNVKDVHRGDHRYA